MKNPALLRSKLVMEHIWQANLLSSATCFIWKHCCHFLKNNVSLLMPLQLSQFFPPWPPLPSPPPTSIVLTQTVVHFRGSFIYVLWLIPSPPFKESPAPSSPLTSQSVSCSMPLALLLISLFCSLDFSYK